LAPPFIVRFINVPLLKSLSEVSAQTEAASTEDFSGFEEIIVNNPELRRIVISSIEQIL
jgi:hypothetical protein